MRRRVKPIFTPEGRERLIAIVEPGAGSYFRTMYEMNCSPTLLAAVDAALLDAVNRPLIAEVRAS